MNIHNDKMIQNMLQRDILWLTLAARKQNVLPKGKNISLIMVINDNESTFSIRDESLLDMPAEAFFTPDRFMEAGVDVRVNRAKIIKLCPHLSPGGVPTVNALLAFTREELLKHRSFSRKSCDALEKVLAHYGMALAS